MTKLKMELLLVRNVVSIWEVGTADLLSSVADGAPGNHNALQSSLEGREVDDKNRPYFKSLGQNKGPFYGLIIVILRKNYEELREKK